MEPRLWRPRPSARFDVMTSCDARSLPAIWYCRMYRSARGAIQSSIVRVRPDEAPALRCAFEAVNRILAERHVVLCLVIALRLRFGEACEHAGREHILPDHVEVLLLEFWTRVVRERANRVLIPLGGGSRKLLPERRKAVALRQCEWREHHQHRQSENGAAHRFLYCFGKPVSAMMLSQRFSSLFTKSPNSAAGICPISAPSAS